MQDCLLFRMACYSSWAYHTEYLEKKPGVTFINCKKTGVQYFIKQEQEQLMVIFRGTDSLKDLLQDVALCKKTYHLRCVCSQKSKVHRGFLDAYENSDVSSTLAPWITSQIRRVVLTGHSYGAALAVLCAADLQSRYPEKNYEVIVFGCPRVGNHAFQQAYNERVPYTLRIEHGNDAVTKIPIPELNYRHVGSAMHLGEKKHWWKFSLADHAVFHYVEGCYDHQCRKRVQSAVLSSDKGLDAVKVPASAGTGDR